MSVLTVVFHGECDEQKFIKKLVSELTSRNLPNMNFINCWNLQNIDTFDDRFLLVGVVKDLSSQKLLSDYDFVVDSQTTAEEALQKCICKFQRKIDDQQQVLQEMQEIIDEI